MSFINPNEGAQATAQFVSLNRDRLRTGQTDATPETKAADKAAPAAPLDTPAIQSRAEQLATQQRQALADVQGKFEQLQDTSTQAATANKTLAQTDSQLSALGSLAQQAQSPNLSPATRKDLEADFNTLFQQLSDKVDAQEGTLQLKSQTQALADPKSAPPPDAAPSGFSQAVGKLLSFATGGNTAPTEAPAEAPAEPPPDITTPQSAATAKAQIAQLQQQVKTQITANQTVQAQSLTQADTLINTSPTAITNAIRAQIADDTLAEAAQNPKKARQLLDIGTTALAKSLSKQNNLTQLVQGTSR